MTVWVISDTHLWHFKLERLGVRPEGFTEILRDNCLRLIKPGDLVIHLGDVSMYKDSELAGWMNDMPGNWILVRGNHDHKSTFYQNRGFVLAVEYFVQKVNGLTILFSHEPFSPLPADVDYNIHGHLHKQDSVAPNHRAEDYADDEFYQANRHRYILIEIESNLAPRKIDDILLRKQPTVPPKHVELPQEGCIG